MTKDKEKYTLKELTSLLTDKNKKFCHRWIIDFNNVKSYMFAYPDCKYKSASASADKLLENTRIKQYIDFIKDDIAKEAGISKLSLINELKKIAFASIAEINEDWVTRKDFKQLKKDNPDILDAIHETDTKVIKKTAKEYNKESGEFEDVPYDIEYVKIKFDKRGAIQDILKAMGWNEPDKVDLTTLGNPITQVFKIGDQEITF